MDRIIWDARIDGAHVTLIAQNPRLVEGDLTEWDLTDGDETPYGTVRTSAYDSTLAIHRRMAKIARAYYAAQTAPREHGAATLKRDVNGRTIVGGDTVVWETEDGRSHHAGYVSERQDSDPIDVRVQPLGAAGDTYVVIRTRRLRIAKQGNQGQHTVADLVDMADVLEAPQPKAVSIPRYVGAGRFVEDDKTVSEAVVSVQEPKFEVLSADFHRNGVSGRGFYVGLVRRREDGNDAIYQIVALPENADDEADLSKITFDGGHGVEVYVTDLMTVAQRGTVAFGINSFRGDHFIEEAVAIIRQVRQQWDNQMLRLNR